MLLFLATLFAQLRCHFLEKEIVRLWCNGDINSYSVYSIIILIHYGLLTPYGNIDLCKYWPRHWLVAWRHQAITFTNVDLSPVKSSAINLRASSREISQPSISKISLKIVYLKFHSIIPGPNELIMTYHGQHTICWVISTNVFLYAYMQDYLWGDIWTVLDKKNISSFSFLFSKMTIAFPRFSWADDIVKDGRRVLGKSRPTPNAKTLVGGWRIRD